MTLRSGRCTVRVMRSSGTKLLLTGKDSVKIPGINTKVHFILEAHIVRIPIRIAGYRELLERIDLCTNLYFWPRL